jgi:DNA-binding transcriptional ArsR family regulator
VRQGNKTDEPGAAVISPKLAKTLANPWRAQILAELSSRPMSPSQFVDEVGGELTNISRCFRQLAEWGYVEVVERKTGGHRRGGVEHVYRSIQRAHFDSPSWELLPRYLREDISNSLLITFFTRLNDAIEAGTLDAEGDRHLSWDSPVLDRQAWKELTDRFDEVLDWLPELEAESARRMAESGEEPIPTTVGLAAFRSPKPSEVKAKRKRSAG